MLALYIVIGFCLAFFSKDSGWRFSGWCVVASTIVGWIFGAKAGIIFFFVLLAVLLIYTFFSLKHINDKQEK